MEPPYNTWAGNITENTTWQNKVNVVDNITIQSGVNLAIAPGTYIKINPGKTITVLGTIIAKGTPTQRITFTSSNHSPSPGDWGGIIFSGGGPDTLTYCNIKYAENGLRFINTAPNSYMANDTVSNSSGYGVAVSSTGASNTALRIYKSAIKNNRTEGIRVNNARVSISNSRVENNGSGNINSGINVINAGRLFIDSSFVTNNLGSGIDVSGIGSRVSLSPDEIKRGYNTVTGHGLSEIYVRNSATALLGYRAAINYCVCDDYAFDKFVDQFSESSEIESKSPQCPPGCYPAVRYEARAGWNNVYNNFNYNCRLINNATSNTVQARYNYWGTGSLMFCGPVDTLSQLGSPVNTPAKLEGTDLYVESELTKEDRTRIREWLLQLQLDIKSNQTNSIDALYQLALYVGPGGEYSDALEMPWEFLLAYFERNSRLQNVKMLASVFLVTAKMDRGEYSNAIYIADQILQRNNDDNMWFFCQTQKVIANVGLGNVTNAISLFNAMKSRGDKIDKKSIEVLEDYLKNVSSTTNSNVKISDNTIQTVQKINIEANNIERPQTYSLEQCYPNPFNPVTKIKYTIPEPCYVLLKIFDVLGREITTLLAEHQESGYKTVELSGLSLPSGVYFYKLQSGKFLSIKKMLLTK
ncbi:MAG: T9SS type A sorting domain-containing protein [Bacteroidota bacterium]|nr:T9SS type A sorting domain-containing protein [Bacteroidota bacterium]